jgi:hypothetical protein
MESVHLCYRCIFHLTLVMVLMVSLLLLHSSLNSIEIQIFALKHAHLVPMNITLNFQPSDLIEVRPIEDGHKWALATLITLSAGKQSKDHAITYTKQAVLLARQLSERYPQVPLLAVVAQGQISDPDVSLLSSAGYQILKRRPIKPAYVTSTTHIPTVYQDQFMKFWLWNETEYDRIVYIDSDTFFTNSSLVDFQSFFQRVTEDSVVACPTSWSQVDSWHQPISWNGGFFIVRPSASRFHRLIWSQTTPSHFSTHYGADRSWLDATEMGALMRDFPVFVMPTPLWQYCADVQLCCVAADRKICHSQFVMPKRKGIMVHGLKPDGLVQTGQPLTSIFNNQRMNVFKTWGYDPECLLVEFIEPLTKFYTNYGLLSRPDTL